MKKTESDRFDEHLKSAELLFESERDDLAQLESWKFERVGSIQLGEDKRLVIRFDDGVKPNYVGVYAFVAGKTVVRTGSGKDVAGRLKEYPRHINQSYHEGKTEKTPLWEAQLSLLIASRFGTNTMTLWARESVSCECALGRVEPPVSCKAEESVICGQFKSPGLEIPVLNRSNRFN